MGIIRLAVALLCFLLLLYYGCVVAQFLTGGKMMKLKKEFKAGKAFIPFYYFFYLDNSEETKIEYEVVKDSSKEENKTTEESE